MPAKYWLLPLFALALLVFAAHGPARADQEQFVVTYVEFLPAKHGSLLLIPFGSLAPLQLPGRGLKVAFAVPNLDVHVGDKVIEPDFQFPSVAL